MNRVNLTKEIFKTAKVSSNTNPEGILMYQEMNACILDGWSMDMYISYLSQYFTYESIEPIINPIWSKCVLLGEYLTITKTISTLGVGSQDWLMAIEYQASISKDLIALTIK